MRARAKPASKGETAAPAAGSAGERPLPGAATGVSRREAPALLMAAVACFWGALYLYVPILTPYAETLGASMTLLGLIVSSYGFSQLVLRIPVGIWSDRIGRRKPFIAAGLYRGGPGGAGAGALPGAVRSAGRADALRRRRDHVGRHHGPVFQLLPAAPGGVRDEPDQLCHHADAARGDAGRRAHRGGLGLAGAVLGRGG